MTPTLESLMTRNDGGGDKTATTNDNTATRGVIDVGNTYEDEEEALINDGDEGIELNIEPENANGDHNVKSSWKKSRSATATTSKGGKKKCFGGLLALLILGGGIAAALWFTVFSNDDSNDTVDKSSAAEDFSGETNGEWVETEVSPYPEGEEGGDSSAESTSSFSTGLSPDSTPDEIANHILKQTLPASSYEAVSVNNSPQSKALSHVLNDDGYLYDWDGIISGDEDATRNFIQRYVLSSLYYGLAGKNWEDNTNWNSNLDVCTWYGVGCDGNPASSNDWDSGVVTSLELYDNGLEGVLMEDVVALTGLTTMEFHSNYIEGSIPSSIYSMSWLSILFLDDNYITGTISSDIGNMKSLTRLTLSDNELEGNIPTEVGGLSELNMLWLFNNQRLGGNIPESLGELTKLGEFYCNTTWQPCYQVVEFMHLTSYHIIHLLQRDWPCSTVPSKVLYPPLFLKFPPYKFSKSKITTSRATSQPVSLV